MPACKMCIKGQKKLFLGSPNSVPLLVNIYFIIVTIAFICSLLSFRLHMGLHMKVLSIVLGITILHEYFSRFINGPVLHVHYNTHLYNIFALVEYTGYSCYYLALAKSKWEKNIIKAFLVLFPVVWYILVIKVFGLLWWNGYIQVIGSLFIAYQSMYYYCRVLLSDEVIHLNKTPEFWIATGMIFFYSCNLPYFGALNYLMLNHMELAVQLISVLRVLNIVMYSLFIYAFLCQYSLYKATPRPQLPSAQPS